MRQLGLPGRVLWSDTDAGGWDALHGGFSVGGSRRAKLLQQIKFRDAQTDMTLHPHCFFHLPRVCLRVLTLLFMVPLIYFIITMGVSSAPED